MHCRFFLISRLKLWESLFQDFVQNHTEALELIMGSASYLLQLLSFWATGLPLTLSSQHGMQFSKTAVTLGSELVWL